MKSFFKTVLRFLIIFVSCFACVYCLVFAGGWKLIESGDIFSVEICASVVMALVLFYTEELVNNLRGTVSSLEKRVEQLEKARESGNNKL